MIDLRGIAALVVVLAAVLVPTIGSKSADETVPVVVAAEESVASGEPTEPASIELAEFSLGSDSGPALEALVYQRAAEAGRSSDGVGVSVTVSHRDNIVSVAGAAVFDPASTAKVYWVAAAVDALGTEAVEPYAEAIFASSDNTAASRVIDLVGIDAINEFTAAAGMADTYLSLWIDGGVRRTGAEAAERGFVNASSTADAVVFLDQLGAGELLDPAATAQVMAWMTKAPDSLDNPTAWGGVLTDQLPAEVAAFTMHKAGWLTPGCCVALDNQLQAIGIVPLPDGDRFSIAITTADGADYEGQASWISGLTAEIYELLAAPT